MRVKLLHTTNAVSMFQQKRSSRGGVSCHAVHNKTRQKRTGIVTTIALRLCSPLKTDAAFLDELIKLQTENRNFRLVTTMTNAADSRLPWKGETGFVDKQMLSKYLGELAGHIYYIAGPPAMVYAMTKLLSDAGLKAAEIRSEEFIGY